jgi:hypothetical protein
MIRVFDQYTPHNCGNVEDAKYASLVLLVGPTTAHWSSRFLYVMITFSYEESIFMWLPTIGASEFNVL